MITSKDLIVGKTIRLRDADLGDAAFILGLRLDPGLNRFLSSTKPDLAAQTDWIRRYRAERGQFYFIIEDGAGCPVGTVRVYDLRPDSFCWGSWIVQPNAPRKAAIESALLIYEFGFNELDFPNCHFDVRKGNQKVVDFHTRLGARIVDESDQDWFFQYSRADYERIRPQYLALLPEPRKTPAK